MLLTSVGDTLCDGFPNWRAYFWERFFKKWRVFTVHPASSTFLHYFAETWPYVKQKVSFVCVMSGESFPRRSE